jgi:hypothetical protein
MRSVELLQGRPLVFAVVIVVVAVTTVASRIRATDSGDPSMQRDALQEAEL